MDEKKYINIDLTIYSTQIPKWFKSAEIFCMTSSYEESKLFDEFSCDDQNETHTVFVNLDYNASVSYMHLMFNHVKFQNKSVIFVNCLTNIIDINLIADYIKQYNPESVLLTDAINLHNYI